MIADKYITNVKDTDYKTKHTEKQPYTVYHRQYTVHQKYTELYTVYDQYTVHHPQCYGSNFVSPELFRSAEQTHYKLNYTKHIYITGLLTFQTCVGVGSSYM